jgi:hypothetical protein
MADEIYNRIEKQLEGNSLALSAVAEVLQKMDAKMSEQEEITLAKQEEDAAVADRQSLIKEIASEVATIIKADAGMDVSGEPRAAGGTGKSANDADDSETEIAPTSKIEDQQATIQAMAHEEEKDEEEEDKEESVEKAMQYKEETDEGKDVDKEEDDDDDDEIKAMAKQLSDLKKQVADYEVNMQKSIQTESEDRLRKMGFREETSLNAPKMIDTLGVDGTEVLQKGADSTDTIDQLTNLSYKELRDLQTNIEAGNTDGVPRELLGQ